MPAALGAESLSVAATGRPLPRCLPPRRSDPAAGFAAGGLSLRAALRCGRAYAAGGLSLRAGVRCGLPVAACGLSPARPIGCPQLTPARACARPPFRPPAQSAAAGPAAPCLARSVGFGGRLPLAAFPRAALAGGAAALTACFLLPCLPRGGRRSPRCLPAMLRLTRCARLAGGAARPPIPLALCAPWVVLRRARCSGCACVVLARGHRFKPPWRAAAPALRAPTSLSLSAHARKARKRAPPVPVFPRAPRPRWRAF